MLEYMGKLSREIKFIKENPVEKLEFRSTKLIMKNSQDDLACILETAE